MITQEDERKRTFKDESVVSTPIYLEDDGIFINYHQRRDLVGNLTGVESGKELGMNLACIAR